MRLNGHIYRGHEPQSFLYELYQNSLFFIYDSTNVSQQRLKGHSNEVNIEGQKIKNVNVIKWKFKTYKR